MTSDNRQGFHCHPRCVTGLCMASAITRERNRRHRRGRKRLACHDGGGRGAGCHGNARLKGPHCVVVLFCLVVRPSALLFSTQQTRPPGCRPDVHFSKRRSPPVCKAHCPSFWAVTGPKFLGRLHLPAPTLSRQLQGLMSLSSWDVHPLSRVLLIRRMPLPSALPTWHLGALFPHQCGT